MTNKEKIKEILTQWNGKTLSSNEQFNEEFENTLQEYGQWVRQQTLEEASNILQKEKDTWANQSIGYKAVESVENALQALKDKK